MDGLDINSILTDSEAEQLFDTEPKKEDPQKDTVVDNKETTDPTDQDKTTEVIDGDSIFSSESVGSKEDTNIEEKKDPTKTSDGTPDNLQSSYASIAYALHKDGVLPDLDKDTIEGIKSPEDFEEAIEKTINARFDERQKRIDEALKVGVEPSAIKTYEDTLGYLNNISDDTLNDESDDSVLLRKKLIYQDAINRGFDQKRAQREVETSFNSGSDKEDALEALKANKDYFGNQYKSLIDSGKATKEQEVLNRKKEVDDLKKAIVDSDTAFGNISVDKTSKQRAFDAITKPIYKDDNGQYLTEMQKYQKENRTDFMKNLGIIYALTDGFKSMDKILGTQVKKKLGSALREVSHKLNTTQTNPDGSLQFISGANQDDNSSSHYVLDI